MKSPVILDGLTFAVIVSLGAALASLVLGGLLVYGVLFELLMYAVTLAYLLYLLKRSQARIGRVVVIASWALISLGCWFFDLALLEQVLIQAGIIWLVRSLYFHGSLLTAALDFGLVSAGLAAAAWALLNTGSLVAALWSFFLLQSLFCWLPQLAHRHGGEDLAVEQHHSSFQSAHRVALDAVRKLSQP
jgi:hypothetical protein